MRPDVLWPGQAKNISREPGQAPVVLSVAGQAIAEANGRPDMPWPGQAENILQELGQAPVVLKVAGQAIAESNGQDRPGGWTCCGQVRPRTYHGSLVMYSGAKSGRAGSGRAGHCCCKWAAGRAMARSG